MTVRQRPTPLHPTVETWAELDELLDRRMAALYADCYDGETIQSIGQSAHNRSLGKWHAFDEVRRAIAPAVETEADERTETAAADSIEAQYKAAGYDDMPPTIQRLMDGDR